MRMSQLVVFFVFFGFSASSAMAVDWSNARDVETAAYVLTVPPGAQKFPNMSSGEEYGFSVRNNANLNIPPRSEGRPVFVTAYVSSAPATSLEGAERWWIAKRYARIKDLQKKSFKSDDDETEGVWMRANAMVYQRKSATYSYVTYSEQAGRAYAYWVTILYQDTQNSFLDDNSVDDAIEEMFKRFSLKRPESR